MAEREQLTREEKIAAQRAIVRIANDALMEVNIDPDLYLSSQGLVTMPPQHRGNPMIGRAVGLAVIAVGGPEHMISCEWCSWNVVVGRPMRRCTTALDVFRGRICDYAAEQIHLRQIAGP